MRLERPHAGRAALTALSVAAVLSAVALPAARAAPPEGRIVGAGAPGAVGDSYIVTLRPGPDGVRAPSGVTKDLARKYGASIRHTYGSALNGCAVRADAASARRLAADPRVASVVQDTAVRLEGAQPSPPWGLDRTDQRTLPLDASYSWPKGGGRGTTVYVIDTGVRTSHRDFGGRARSGWDFIDGDATAQDGNGHGTHVASIAAGTSYGVAKGADVVGVRVLDHAGAGTTAQVIAGVDWVTKHARRPAVANLSLGGYANPQLDAAVRNSIASGVTYTIAAGNAGLPARLFSPARVREAITVGATDGRDRRAGFSNWGAGLDLFAPGVGITAAAHTGDTASQTLSGTSMASPHAAGAAALYLAGHARATPADVVSALTDGASEGRVTRPGPGSPNRLLQVTG
ncbi:S8 family peptidase [Streptomyces sp. NPDC057445]|uniref:S8 family peptidase n=1 Tax=Streptomyces sp. NPDC057445 TaxID=3346136 RepID=UPI0036CA8DEE